jgi:ornithine carbamoyltransferase
MDLLRLNDLTSSNLHKLIDRAVEMEHEFRAGTLRPTLAGKRVVLIVDDSGWRNTTALDLGMRHSECDMRSRACIIRRQRGD